MAFLPRKRVISRSSSLPGGEAYLAKLKESFRQPLGSHRTPVIGGQASLDKVTSDLKRSKAKEVKVKEVKKDLSIFQGKQYLTRPEVGRLFKKDWAWKITKLPANVRSKLGEKLWDLKKYGIYIDPREAKKVFEDLKNYPDRARTRYGVKRSEVPRMRNLLRKFVGK
jgi:hypothetical protein